MKNELNEWNCQDVINWFNSQLEMKNYDYNIILSNEINGRDLIDLTEDNLKSDLKIVKLHDRKLIMRKISELIKNIIDVKNPDQVNDDIHNNKNDLSNSHNDHKIITLVYLDISANFRCTNNLKTNSILREFIELCNIKINCLTEDKFFLVDSKGSFIPKESFIKDVVDDGETFQLIIKCERESNSINNNYSVNPFSNYNNKKININIDEPSSIIMDTGNKKNRYLSFDALDNFEKNGYMFTVNNLSSKLDKLSDNEKVTINSFYNISNLNNYHNRSLKSFQSPFSSFDNRSSNIILNSNITNTTNMNNILNTKSNKKKPKLCCLNIKKKIEFEDFSENEAYQDVKITKTNFSLPNENKMNKDRCIQGNESNPQKHDYFEIGDPLNNKKYTESLANQTCFGSENSMRLYEKNQFFDKLNYYYTEANKIKNNNYLQNNSSRNFIYNRESSMNNDPDREQEMNKMLQSIKKYSTFIIPSDNVTFQNAESKLKNYIQESRKYKNSIKNNLHHLIHKNITSSISNDKQMDSSTSN